MKTPRLMNALVVRPRLLIALAAGAAVAVGLFVLAPKLRLSSVLIGGWDVFAASYILLLTQTMFGAETAQIRRRAARDDEGRVAVLILVLAACVAAFAGAGVDLHLAKQSEGLDRALHVALAIVTVMASWMLVQMIFAVHYAHGYYTRDLEPNAGRGPDAGGLLFPGKKAPDYWDFVHFSIVIGVASQTADVAFTSKGMRRLGTVHSLAAFAFNTMIVALTINLLAGLF